MDGGASVARDLCPTGTTLRWGLTAAGTMLTTECPRTIGTARCGTRRRSATARTTRTWAADSA